MTLAFVFWVFCLFGMGAYFKTGSCYIPWAGLKLMTLLPHPPSTGIAGVYHYTCPALLVFNYFKKLFKIKNYTIIKE